MKKQHSLFISLICLAFYLNAQTKPAINIGLEIKSERSMYAKVFSKESGVNQAIISGSPVHYKKNGLWEDINTNITFANGIYQNESNVIKTYFPYSIEGSNKIKLVVDSKDELFIHSEKKLVLLNNQNEIDIVQGNSNNSIANVVNNKINYSGIYNGISDEFTVLNGQLKNNLVLSSVPDLLTNLSSGYFGFQETIELPIGWKITTLDKTANGLTSSALEIVDVKGEHVLSIPVPVFFDNYELASDGSSMVEGKYLVKQENDVWHVSTLVPIEWLKDSNTKYPVSIDPTVVIVGTTGGWQSPNNWVDNPGFVFVGVCCGNLTHRGWIKFNISGIPTTSCITNVELQVTMSTVNSANPELVLVNDVTGAFGPYGAIVPAAYNDFGTGFYTSFTILGLGTYGYFSLGASANSLLQAQLPGGWFQTAFQFNNEPSIDWKNINATSSNLRVTYAAPPCVLPIELISFDAKCINDKVKLSWETASQKNNDYFTIERSVNGINYETIGTVEGEGNSNQNLNYSFVDGKPTEGTLYYRIKQSDFNGHFEYLNSVAVICNKANEFTIKPNPSNGKFIVEGVEQDAEIIITDVFGQIVFQTKTGVKKIEIDLDNKSNGIYLFKQSLKQVFFQRKLSLTNSFS